MIYICLKVLEKRHTTNNFLKDLNVTSIRPSDRLDQILSSLAPPTGLTEEVCGLGPLGNVAALFFFFNVFLYSNSTYYTINNNLPRHNNIMTCKRNLYLRIAELHCVLSKDTHKLVFIEIYFDLFTIRKVRIVDMN